jgi:hypothetical protein
MRSRIKVIRICNTAQKLNILLILHLCCGSGSGSGRSVTNLPPGSGSINSELRIWILTIYQRFKEILEKMFNTYFIIFHDPLPGVPIPPVDNIFFLLATKILGSDPEPARSVINWPLGFGYVIQN